MGETAPRQRGRISRLRKWKLALLTVLLVVIGTMGWAYTHFLIALPELMVMKAWSLRMRPLATAGEGRTARQQVVHSLLAEQVRGTYRIANERAFALKNESAYFAIERSLRQYLPQGGRCQRTIEFDPHTAWRCNWFGTERYLVITELEPVEGDPSSTMLLYELRRVPP